mgnify:FL=1
MIGYEKLKPNTFIFDLDGTLCDANGRNYYTPTDKEILADLPIKSVINVLNSLYMDNYQIIFVSGREDKYFRATIIWLMNNTNLSTDVKIFMRKTGDKRPDNEIKTEIYNNFIKDNYNVLGVFDDREKVIKAWKELGLFVFDVSQGKGNF